MDTFPNEIAKYKFLEPIGRGATSEVYSAVCLTNNRPLAIKKIDLELYPIELEFLRQEVSFWSSSCHPNIVGYYGSFMEGSVIYILMEYLAAGSVYDIMRYGFTRGFKDEIQIATLLKGMTEALQYIHANGQIHRDVKPGNALVGSDGAVKMGDFGVAASLLEQGQRQRARYTVIGTPCYMAPEVLSEDFGYTEKADIWSLGITAIELATGEAPYSRLKPMEVMVKILKSPPPTLPTNVPFSNEFRDFVSMCLKVAPKERPTAESLLQHAFLQKAKGDDYIKQTLISKLPPIGTRLKSIEGKLSFTSICSQEEPKVSAPNWDFDGADADSEEEKPVEEGTKQLGRFKITKQPSGNNSNIEKRNDELESEVARLNGKVEAMGLEMEVMKDQIRLLTQALQKLMQGK